MGGAMVPLRLCVRPTGLQPVGILLTPTSEVFQTSEVLMSLNTKLIVKNTTGRSFQLRPTIP
jgi:hypothetical protein